MFTSAAKRSTAVLLLGVLVASFALAGCGRGSAATAVRDDVIAAAGVDPEIMTVHAVTGGSLVLYAYPTGQQCVLGFRLAEQDQGKWLSGGGGQGGGPCPGQAPSGGTPVRPFSHAKQGGHGPLSVAGGWLFDSAIANVDVEWLDGVTTQAEVQAGRYYVSFRDDTIVQVANYHYYDGAGNLLFTLPGF